MGKSAFFSAEATPARPNGPLAGRETPKGLRLIFRLLLRSWKRHPWQTITAGISIVLVAAMWVIEPVYSSYAIDQLLLIKEGIVPNYMRIFGVWVAIFVLLSVIQGVTKYLGWQIDNRLILERREEVYEHVLNLSVAFHTKQKSGEIIKQIDEGADNLVDLQRNLFLEFGPSLLAAVAFLFFGARIHWLLTAILSVSLLLYMGVAMIGTKRTQVLQYGVNKLWVEAIGRAFDAATNIFTVQSSAKEGHEMDLMRASHGKAFNLQQRVNYRWAFLEAINFFMLTRILLVSVGILLYVQNEITLGELYFFQFSFFRVLTPFEMIAGLLPQWNKKVGKVRLSEMILETPNTVRNRPDAKTPTELRGAIMLENVCFRYDHVPTLPDLAEEHTASAVAHLQEKFPEEELPVALERAVPAAERPHIERVSPPEDERKKPHAGEVLHGINLEIRSGEHIAFVGHSGAGKSTMAMLLNRFYDVTEGRILVDGTDLRDLDLHWWRSQIGLVLQENIMFNDTILSNIRYARPEATEEEVREAAHRAAAAEFIELLPESYATLIGDRGIRLSGGQRQRVAIARAILKRPRIVILDEATSALDSVTERNVQEGIRELITGRTACIIAHRLSTVRSVNRIAVLHKGKLIACAPHEELLKTCDSYREMVELQSHGMLAE